VVQSDRSKHTYLNRSLAGFGWESFAWVRYTGFTDGGLPMGSIPGARTGDGRFDGETSLGGLLIFFLGGTGEGKRSSRVRLPERFFAGRTGSKQSCLCYILYVE
jgi:hypothetical protein